MLTECEEIIVDSCACCGNEVFEGDEVLQIPLTDYYFCSQQCVFDQMLKEKNLLYVIAK